MRPVQQLYDEFPLPHLFGLSKGGFVEKKDLSPLSGLHDLRSVDRVGAISIFSCRGRRTGQTMIRNDFSFGSYKIRSVLDAVQLINRDFIKVYHVSDDMIRTLFFFKKEATNREYGVSRESSVTVTERSSDNEHRFLRFKFMKEYLVSQCLAKESKHRGKQLFQSP